MSNSNIINLVYSNSLASISTESISSLIGNMFEDLFIKRTLTYSELESMKAIIYEGATKKCMICLNIIQNGELIRILPCIHLFHKKCAEKWLSSYSVKCPICKKKIVKGAAQLGNS